MEQPLLIPVKLEMIDFTKNIHNYAIPGLEPRTSTLQYLRQFARTYRPA
ncbi:MAG: hypothetical protein IJ700_04660 [Bacteroidaceae bacterium]|nr:hypothetical protein [Bacteroidaceae bacterium]